MESREKRTFILGILTGSLAVVFLLGGAAAAWGWHEAVAARSHGLTVPILPVQQAPQLNPKEFIPFPNNGNGVGPGPQNNTPGFGAQNCDKILYFYQGRLYQLQPGPMPRNGGNPEFFYMQPYEGPQIPGFPSPGPMIPGVPGPGLPGQQTPPTFRF